MDNKNNYRPIKKLKEYVNNMNNCLLLAKHYSILAEEMGKRWDNLKTIHEGIFTLILQALVLQSVIEIVKVWEIRGYSKSNSYTIHTLLNYVQSNSKKFGLNSNNENELWKLIRKYSQDINDCEGIIKKFQTYRDRRGGHLDKAFGKYEYSKSMKDNQFFLIDKGLKLINSFSRLSFCFFIVEPLSRLLYNHTTHDEFDVLQGIDYSFLDQLSIVNNK